MVDDRGCTTAVAAGIAIAAGGGSGGGGDDHSGGNTPVPPDDGAKTTTYPNGLSITMVPGADTATFNFNGQTFSGKKQSDTLWSLTDKDGKVVYVTSLDQVSGALNGFSVSDRKTWALDGTEPLGVASWTSDYQNQVTPAGGQYLNSRGSLRLRRVTVSVREKAC
ncbi:hypothetical protein [Rahnella aceris]|uniref:hypothetical protein n=1 Tax=Rahnella sp. (strain Y9602) TaxID=2703885 RepID=UPI001C25A353|nr:hypothetical protein [Rahnella aceris]MBU9848787.1 hypothetical protein [Rahnella aceris]